MFISYYTSHWGEFGRGHYYALYAEDDLSLSIIAGNASASPSDCVWMIPGTVED